MKNWATNITFHDAQTLHPKSIEQLTEIVSSYPKVRARGSAHCFNTIADSRETVVVLDAMPKEMSINTGTKIATVGAGLNYAQISEFLYKNGWAVHNLASLPHISIAGAVATGTHGSGIKNGPLHTAIRTVTLLQADGNLRTLVRDVDPEFFGSIVSLGLAGIVISYEIDIEPSFSIYQTVYGDMSCDVFSDNILEILSSAYNVSFFTRWGRTQVGDVWLKSKTEPPRALFDTKPRTEKAHPIFGEDADSCTDQLGIPGPWHLRLPHFRIDANPSAGNELQSEFFVDSQDAQSGFRAIQAISEQFASKLLVTEIRSMAADKHWLSPSYDRETVAFHFTWKNDYEIPYLVSLIEDALEPFNFRAHFGKVFNVDHAHFKKVFPKFTNFKELIKNWDPEGKFQNEFTVQTLGL